MRKPTRTVTSVSKATNYAVITNALELVLIVGITVYVLFAGRLSVSQRTLKILVGAAGLMVAVAAVLDIRDALQLRKLLEEIDALESTVENMEDLNNKLRAQRHDFLNHLQVVYSLMEMQDYQEAGAYIEKVYGTITSLSRVMKTASAPINALLQAKISACESAGIHVQLDIRSSWKTLGIPAWEMCKVLGNLIDNAMDALHDETDKQLSITLTEDVHSCRFVITNNGETIPPKMREAIFEAGVTTKSDGHGMGLYIVKTTLEEYGGGIELRAEEHCTTFEGWVPHEQHPASVQEGRHA